VKFRYLFYFCNGFSSVIDSQVIALLNAIHEKKYFKKTYLFMGIRNENQKKEFLNRKLSPEIKTVFFKTFPNYRCFNYMNRKSIQQALLSQSINLKEAIYHERGEILAWHLSEVLGIKHHCNILPDVRGAVEEIEEFANYNKVIKSLKINLNKRAIKNLNKFNKISVISNSLRDHLISNYNIDFDKLDIRPCLASNDFKFNEQQRDKTRKEFNLNRDDILLYFPAAALPSGRIPKY
jgi:hypothetical protein